MIDIYDTNFVEKLFDEMAGTYEAVNYLSSFGFSKRWRAQFVSKAVIKPDMVVCDLMCGMGECWSPISSNLKNKGHIVALDLSNEMLKGATRRKVKFHSLNMIVQKQDALINTLEDECADCIICGFGVKTLSNEQKEMLAYQIKRILKPQGTFSLIEVSVPTQWVFKGVYMFYLKEIIPLIGRLLLGNPENYRMLRIYSERFKDCRVMYDILAQCGLQVTYHNYFDCGRQLMGQVLQKG